MGRQRNLGSTDLFPKAYLAFGKVCGMSALPPNDVRVTSGVPPTTDIRLMVRDGRKVPQSDIAPAARGET